jgi:SMODS and SLOG-associating 2TM effector domain 3/SMODS and SLOG-associating 2TM effector domain 1
VSAPLDIVATLDEASLPTLFSDADRGARQAQGRLLRLTSVLLAASIFAAIFGVLSLEHDGRDYAAAGSLVGLGVGLLATVALALDNPKKRWYDLRALAESVKSLGTLYAVAGGDFGYGKQTNQEAREDFATRLAELREQFGSELKSLSTAPAAITEEMMSLRAQSLANRRAAYLSGRLRDQKGWYTLRSQDHSRAGKRWLLLTGAAQATGFVFAALRLFEVVHVDLGGIAATVAVAAAAWLRTNDHSGVAEAYRQTAHELSEIEATIREPGDEAEWATWVGSAETAMSREHTSWLARRRTLL